MCVCVSLSLLQHITIPIIHLLLCSKGSSSLNELILLLGGKGELLTCVGSLRSVYLYSLHVCVYLMMMMQ